MLELMKTFAASLAGVAAIAATQLFLTPQQTGIAVAAVLIIVLFRRSINCPNGRRRRSTRTRNSARHFLRASPSRQNTRR